MYFFYGIILHNRMFIYHFSIGFACLQDFTLLQSFVCDFIFHLKDEKKKIVFMTTQRL